MPRVIVFVCTGNTCRSPLAEAAMKKLASEEGLDLDVKSAGLAVFGGLPAPEAAKEAAKEAGLDLSEHLSHPFSKDMALASELIITMTRKHKEAIVKKLPMLSDKVLTLEEAAGGGEGDIEDPIGGDLDDYRAVRDRILGCLGRTVMRLKEGKL